MTWFPTFIFMEYLLPRVFGWEDFLNGAAPTKHPLSRTPCMFPKLRRWFQEMMKGPAMQSCRQDIWEYWVEMDAKGQFAPIIQEVAEAPEYKWMYTIEDRA